MHKPRKTSIYLRCIVILSFLLSGVSTEAKNYYFSSSSGSDSYTSTQAQSQATPWKTIAKLNSFFSSIVAGDNIYFMRGDTFYGAIMVTKSGSSGLPITIGAYGTGSNPVITGFTTLSSWTLVGNGIYECPAATASNTVNLVTLNGVAKAVGRYPNAGTTNGGYLTYESSSGTSSITDNQLTSATNWTGAEVVIRKTHFIMERCKITSHSGGTLTYGVTSGIYPNAAPTSNTCKNGYGYFIQRDVRTLDQLGEWYFNTGTKKMQMYFGSNVPSSYTIKVSTVDNLINIGSQKYISVNNISLEGGNVAAIYANGSGNLTINSCDINLIGAKGIFILYSGNILVDGVGINNALCGAIDINSTKFTNATIRNCTIKNTAMIAGMGSFWNDTDYKGICVNVANGALVEYNTLENTGFMGIQFNGSNITIKNNFINFYNIVKDDGGGIYTYQTGTDASPGTIYTNRVIKENIIMNGIGAVDGSLGNIDVDGIFLDGRVTNVDILNNTIANIGVNGIYSNNAINLNIRGNTCFNNGCALGLTRYELGYFSNLSVKQNIFYPKYSTQTNFKYQDYDITKPVSYSIQTLIKKLGILDSNYWATPNNAGFINWYATSGTYTFPAPMGFAAWKSYTNHETASKLPSKIAANVDTDLRFEYNATKVAKTIPLNAKYVGVDGTAFDGGSITLQPYTSKILVVNGALTNNNKKLAATAVVPPISCFGGSTTFAVTSSGGTAPYTGTGSYSVNAGKGSLKISVANPVARASTFLYSTIGAVSSAKTYVLRFSTLGTTANSSLKASIRQTFTPWAYITPTQSRTFGMTRVDHEFIFTAPSTTGAASFLIELLQSSGTTYIDNIAFFEATSTGELISNNLYSSGQFESSISGITTWSGSNNHVATLDLASKISNTYYYPVKDATGAVATATVKTTQPATALRATVTAGNVTVTGGTTTVVVSATGGTAPYTGTGSFYNVPAGTSSYTVRDVMGCVSVATITVQSIAAIIGGQSLSSFEHLTNNKLKVFGYPNPTTTEFVLTAEGGSNEILNISVLSIDGRIAYRTQGPSNKRYKFGSKFTSGTYIIQVIQGKTMRTLKVVKAK